jgi:hypothetical protein
MRARLRVPFDDTHVHIKHGTQQVRLFTRHVFDRQSDNLHTVPCDVPLPGSEIRTCRALPDRVLLTGWYRELHGLPRRFRLQLHARVSSSVPCRRDLRRRLQVQTVPNWVQLWSGRSTGEVRPRHLLHRWINYVLSVSGGLRVPEPRAAACPVYSGPLLTRRHHPQVPRV